MKANELIGILTEMVNRHGDLEIGVEDFELEYLVARSLRKAVAQNGELNARG